MNLTDQPRAFDPETYPDVFPTTAAADLDAFELDETERNLR